MKKSSSLSTAAALLVWVANPAFSAAPVYEGFDYAGGQNLLTVTGGGTGWGGNWVSTTNGIAGTTDPVGLTLGALATTGGSLAVTKPSGGQWQFLSRSVGTAIANTETLYESFLFQYNGAGGDGAPVNFGISVGDSTGAGHTLSLMTRSYINPPTAGRIGYGDNQFGQLNYSTSINDGSTFLFIGKWTNLGGASQATGWVLSLANFDAISGGAITEADLDANNISTATFAGPAGSFGTSQFVKIGDYMDGDFNYKVDEVRFANALTDVVPVPEPATVALLAAGGLGWVLLRRRAA